MSAINKQDKKHFKKIVSIYLLLSILTIIITNVYTLFGHGVRSNAMDYLFLFPLLCGVTFFGIALQLSPNILFYKYYRLAFNIYNSGIASLVVSRFLIGVMEIAGTASKYNNILFLIGLFFTLMGAFIIVYAIFANRKVVI